jgi:hypothetical protein
VNRVVVPLPEIPKELARLAAIVEQGQKIYRDREKPHSSPLPHHRAYGSVHGGSVD